MPASDAQSPKKVKIIGCGVFEREVQSVIADDADRFNVIMMDAGLHARPKELKVRLQAEIDATSADEFARIVVLYGLCGRGAVGVMARDVPLVFPRIHDCIAMFLGSADEYWKQFRACPATFYMTPGWFEKKAHPDGYKIGRLKRQWTPEGDPHYAGWADQYGDENATFIVEFFQSWRKNYKRIALINNGLGDVERYRRHVQALAEVSGWRFEELPGELDFFESLILGRGEDPRLLVVPPHHMVIATNDTRIFTSVPADPSEEDVLAATRALSGVETGRFVFAGETAAAQELQQGIGLGIDAGGTYTDAVLMDFEGPHVMSKAKAPTTPHDYSIGIEAALSGLTPELLSRVSLVSLSTTLATNAIVEDRGAHVGLILMPIDEKAMRQVHTRPVRVVPGKMTITGEEVEPTDAEAVREAVEQMLAEGIEAFAVSGYGSVHNPTHEQQVRQVIRSVCDLPIVCGHELSGKLNFIRRAHTAVLNARLIPIIDELLQAVEQVLKRYQVRAPIFIVRGDGTLIEMSVARERAIETILSGPAASAIGAQFLTGNDDIIAVDIGGTTTDVAIVEEGRVAVCGRGAVVGPWQTSVSAADIQTTGLGGDSYVRVYDGGLKVSVGPQRVTPLSFLAARHEHVRSELAEIAEDAQFDSVVPAMIEFFQLVRMRPGLQVSEREGKILDILRNGPLSRRRLAPRVGALAIELLPTTRLEQLGVIRRSAFTPTDIMHVLGAFTAYDVETARLAAGILARYAGREESDFIEWVRRETLRKLAYEVMRREMTIEFGDPDLEQNQMLSALLDEMVTSRLSERKAFSMQFNEHRTVVGIGAPAGALLPEAGALLGARAVVPEHAEVANAVGAVTGNVVVRETVSIRPDESGSFIMMSPLGRKEFGHLREAQREATQHLVHYLRQKGAEYGTDRQEVVVRVGERTGQLNDGSRQFLELVVEGVLEGPPRLTVAAN